jgi:hypothetical protein
MERGRLADLSQIVTENTAGETPTYSLFSSGCPNQEIGSSILFVDLKKSTVSYFGLLGALNKNPYPLPCHPS